MPAFPPKIIKCRYLWKKFHTIKQSIFLIFYYIEYDYIALSPDQYNFFKKNLCHILPNVNVFSRRHISFSFIVEAGPEIYRSNKIYKHI